ncbi:MAG: hypothetical protein AAB734_01230, partial [Patescibacteria group bacterium]
MTMIIAFLIAAAVALGGFFYYQNQGADVPAKNQGTETNTPSQMPALTSVDRSGQNLTKMPSDILRMENL